MADQKNAIRANMLKKKNTVQDFDVLFYRSSNQDLQHFSDKELLYHYVTHGKGEGRAANERQLFENINTLGSVIPDDFVPAVYRRLHPDVNVQCPSDWDVYCHYANHGYFEGRIYSDIDWEFYADLYLPMQKCSRSEVMGHILSVGFQSNHFVSLDSLLHHYDLHKPFWLKDFSEREFFLLNSDWVGGILNRAQALVCFLGQGVERLAPISFKKRFDPAFYREMHPKLKNLTDTNLYWHWLRSSAGEVSECSESEWLAKRSVALEHFPSGFAWREYSARRFIDEYHRNEQDRWHSLEHMLDHIATEATTVPVAGPDAAAFLDALGSKLYHSNHTDQAIKVFERSLSFGESSNASLQLADCYVAKRQWRSALAVYAENDAKAGSQTVWSVANNVKCFVELFDFHSAMVLLESTKSEYGGNQLWRECVESTIEGYFEHVSELARASYSKELRSEADTLLLDAVDLIASWWKGCLLLPVRSRIELNGRVVMLAVTSLKQCKHYRLDQKKEFLGLLDIEVEIFDFDDVEGFITALPDADVAIFYRVPAMPKVVLAILMASSQGIPTYYDIDDLIFDVDLYPDPFESFQGAISAQQYEGLQYGTPLHAAAMRLCDYGLTSTPALAIHVSRYVRTKQTFVVRNALDQSIITPTQKAQISGHKSSAIHVFYGSGTLAHNQDFNDIACHALLPIMISNEDIRLVIAGHLDLDERFDAVGERVINLGMIDDLSTYWSILAGCDINLATLSDTPMNHCKSEIKWLEAAALGVPSIVSATSTYCDVIQQDITGIIASTLDEWAIGLKRLIDYPEKRRAIGSAACTHVREIYKPEVIAQELAQALTIPRNFAMKPQKKRALIVNVFFPPQSVGGATRVVADNLRSWIDSGAASLWDFAIATTDYDSQYPYSEKTESWLGVPVFKIAAPLIHNLDWQPYDDQIKDWFRIVVKRFAPDIVHFHCIQRLTGAIIEVCGEEGIPYVITAHDGWWLSDYQFMYDEACRVRTPGDEQHLGMRPGISMGQSLERKLILDPLLRGAAALLTPSQSFKAIYQDAGYSAAAVLANGLPEIAYKPRNPSRSGRVRMGHIGDTSPHKGFDVIEAALRQNQFDNLELVGVSHAQREGHQICDVWGASPVLLRGKVSQERVGELYADLDVLLAPSACIESYGLVTREANAAGLWVVASDRGAIGEDVRPGIDGFLIDVSTPAALVDVLKIMNENPSKFLIDAPKNNIPSSAEQSAALISLYESIVENNRRIDKNDKNDKKDKNDKNRIDRELKETD